MGVCAGIRVVAAKSFGFRFGPAWAAPGLRVVGATVGPVLGPGLARWWRLRVGGTVRCLVAVAILRPAPWSIR